MLACNIGNYLIKRQSEKSITITVIIIIIVISITLLVFFGFISKVKAPAI